MAKDLKVGDPITNSEGRWMVVIETEKTKSGVQIVRAQRTERETLIAGVTAHAYDNTLPPEEIARIRDGKDGW